MRTLYHYRFSPFSRRVRLALAHKGLEVELRECRDDPASGQRARAIAPFRTIPVLVDEERATAPMGDSSAILHWLDAAYPERPRVWPLGGEAGRALQVVALVDVVLDGVIDLGTRYFALREHAAWPDVKNEMLGRCRIAAEALAAMASSANAPTLCESGWSAADMALLTMTSWIEGWPERVSSSPNVAQLVTLGFQLPAPLSRWADAHRERPDVVAMV